ncbi:MAG: FG-GAP-like repeat-containing protein [Planctomycetota bacterium]
MTRWSAYRRFLPMALLSISVAAVCWFLFGRPSADSLLADAKAAQNRRDHREAFRLACEALELGRGNIDAILLAAESSVRCGQFEEGVRLCLSLPADAQGKQVLEALKEGGQQAIFAGLVSDAETLFQRALKLAPDDLTIHRRLSAIYLAECRRWESHPHLFALVRGRAFTLEELAFVGNTEELYEAEAMLRMFEKAVPDDVAPLMGRARLLMFKNFPRDCEDMLRKIIAAKPELIEAHAQLGVLLVSESRSSELVQWEKNLPPAADTFPEIWWVKGTQARKQGDIRGAIRCAWECLRRDPNHVGASYQLAQLLTLDGQTEKAKAFAERAALLESLCLTIHDILLIEKSAERMKRCGELCERLGRFWESWAWQVAIETYHPSAADKAERERLRALLNDDVPQTIPAGQLALSCDFSSMPLPTLTADSADVATTGTVRNSTVHFEDIAASSGLSFQYENGAPKEGPGFMIYQSIAGGVSVIDLDHDLAPDLFFPQSGPWPVQKEVSRDQIIRNVRGNAVNVTATAIPDDQSIGYGAAVGDYNCDGMQDLYVSNFGVNRLLTNKGDGTFSDDTVTAGIVSSDWTVSSAIADINGDGLPDLYDVNYCDPTRSQTHKCFRANTNTIRTCIPTEFSASDDMLLLNLGDGRFQEVGSEAGIRAVEGRGLGLVVANLDPEPGLDIFISNDMTANYLFSNRTPAPGASPSFEQRGVLAGVAYDSDGRPQACMGIAADDATGDGLIDLFVTNFHSESNTFYEQQAGGGFIDQTRAKNLRDSSITMLSWGTQFIDAELDGRPDLIVVSGHVDDFSDEDIPFRMRPQFYSNNGESFMEVNPETLGPYFQHPQLARGMSRLDWDQDGREDVAIVRLFEPAVLLANRTASTGNSIGIRLTGLSQRDAIGAEIEVVAGDLTLKKQMTAGDGYAASNEKRLVFGIGDRTQVDTVRVIWPSGAEQTLHHMKAGSECLCVEHELRHYLLPGAGQ